MSGGPAKNARTSRIVRLANRLGNLIQAGSMARAILRLIDATSHGRYVEAKEPRSVGLAEGASERRAAAMQLAARLAEAFGSCEAYEMPLSDGLDDPRLRGTGESLRRRLETGPTSRHRGCQ